MARPTDGLAVIIPARFAATRLPGKLLEVVAGRPILEWTWRRAVAATDSETVWVATDDARIASAAEGWGARVLRTGGHTCGTERVAAAARQIDPQPALVINLQGDEPLLDPQAIGAVAAALREDSGVIVTCGAPLRDERAWRDPAVVKVVTGAGERALYFSRLPIPGSPGGGEAQRFADISACVLQHIGLYGYPRALLEHFVQLPASPLEEAEGLEQLRALEAGLPVHLVRIARAAPAVDTPEDLARVRAILEASNGAAPGAQGGLG